ncbi:TIGR00270 family protein [Methanocella sp. CWC-04]|uniref:TIGR00270 family protein n=1 Tax=Methanooceanicella nereidis TaxID=2052831 RepID=A0AAP2W5Z3_9EURY|nr:multiprotein bridging factor aMBF1 [Methanocella sp. CWC-04]MCD1293591.1 TIGR00270 family protein [Methanocella sp. CWC-04]
MQCEICGAQISGRSHRILVDRAELEVCEKCKSFGKEVERRVPPTSLRRGATAPSESSTQPITRRARRDIFDKMKDELVEDYPDVIKDARESRHMSQEELASKIQEKVNIIRKLERGELMPEDALIKKLEAALDIKLTEGVEDSEPSQRRADSKTLTLGDLIKIKKNK